MLFSKAFKQISFLLLMCAVCAIPVFAQGGSWVTVTRKAGVVESNLNNSNTWLRIINTRRLGSNDRARTSTDGAAQLRLADNTILAMGPSTVLKMSSFTLNPNKRDVRMHLQTGQVRAQVSKSRTRSSKFQITSPNAVMAAQGTDFLVKVTNLDGTPHLLNGSNEHGTANADASNVITTLTVYSGTVTITNPSPIVGAPAKVEVVNAGNSFEVRGSTPPIKQPVEIHNQTIEEVKTTPGVGELTPGADMHIQAPIVVDGSTVSNNFGSKPTGTTVNHAPSSSGSGTSGSDAAGGVDAPVQINDKPAGTKTGTVIIDISGVR